MSLWGAVMGGANLILHGGRLAQRRLTASFEKLIIDAELLQMMQAYCQPFAVTPESLAMEAVRDVGPAGHYFGTAHTLARYETAFYQPLISNWDNYDTWVERGARRRRKRPTGFGSSCLRITRSLPSILAWTSPEGLRREAETRDHLTVLHGVTCRIIRSGTSTDEQAETGSLRLGFRKCQCMDARGSAGDEAL